MEIMGEKISDKNDPHMFQDEKITNDKQTRFFSVYFIAKNAAWYCCRSFVTCGFKAN